MQVNSAIFKEYDIRGRYPGEINEAVFYNLGRAIGRFLKPQRVAIGRDARLSSDTLFLYLASGLKHQKAKVIDLGKVTAPFCFWYSKTQHCDALMITASHNPKEENGLKVYSRKLGVVDRKSGLTKIKGILEKLNFKTEIGAGGADRLGPEVWHQYFNFLAGKTKTLPPYFRLAVDFSHGTAAGEVVPVLEKLKVNFATLNEKPNGNFPAHGPNPLEEASQRQLKALMQSKKFDLGAIFDGDGDRVAFMNEKGDVIDPSVILALWLDCFLKPGQAAVKTVNLGRIAAEVRQNRRVKVLISKVGRTNVQQAMAKNRAELGAEKSGHYFFKDFYYGDSAAMALLRMLKVISKNPQPLSKLIKPYQKYIIMPEVNFSSKCEPGDIIAAVKEKFRDGQISLLDGISIEYPEWGLNLRRSNTENLWRLSLEGADQNKLAEIKKEVESILN